MKRLFITMVAAVLAVMLAAPVYAADNLQLSGSYFARAWSVDDAGHAQDTEKDYFHQRFRMQGTINVADDVKAVIRADFAEAIWGDEFVSGSVARPGIQDEGAAPNFDEDGNDYDTMHVDRTYININKEMWDLTVGQQYAGLGILEVFDANITGVNFGMSFEPVDVSLIYAKIDEGGDNGGYGGYNLQDEDNVTNVNGVNVNTEDMDAYVANVGFAMGGFSSNVYGAMINDDSAAEAEPFAVGFMTSGTVGMVNLTGEIDTFGGDNAAGQDYIGTQMYVKADTDVTDMINVGGELFWAAGTDDPNETQKTNLTDWWSWTPTTSNTFLSTWATATLTASAFQPFGYDEGSMGLSVFADFTPMEKLSCGTKIMYLESQEDAYADGEMTSFNAYVAYDLATNTTVSLAYLQSNIDLELNNVDQNLEDEKTLVAEISLAF